MSRLQDFVVSKVRVKLIETFLTDPEEMFYIRELTRKIDEEINAVRRELLNMKQSGMVKEEKRGKGPKGKPTHWGNQYTRQTFHRDRKRRRDREDSLNPTS